jgi:type II secretory pathway pseudopilin PulG
MSNIQTFLVIGGMALIGMLSLTFFKSDTTQTASIINNEAIMAATGIAQSMLDKIQTKAFDENTLGVLVNDVNNLTLQTSFGPDGGETNELLYDDVDDYNNYYTFDVLQNLGIFMTKVKVVYATKFTPETVSSVSTFNKRVDIFLVNSYLADTLKMSHIIGY